MKHDFKGFLFTQANPDGVWRIVCSPLLLSIASGSVSILVKTVLIIDFFLSLTKLLSSEKGSRRFLLETFLFRLLLNLSRFTVLRVSAFIQWGKESTLLIILRQKTSWIMKTLNSRVLIFLLFLTVKGLSCRILLLGMLCD
jgi:hypothetical protein